MPSASSRKDIGELSPAQLTPGTRTRRSSLSSMASRLPNDQGQTPDSLDDIHSRASQSATLTTFNDFSALPPASPNSDDRSSAGQRVQQGIGNLYSRLRGSKTNDSPRASPGSSGQPKSPRLQLEQANRARQVRTKDDGAPQSSPLRAGAGPETQNRSVSSLERSHDSPTDTTTSNTSAHLSRAEPQLDRKRTPRGSVESAPLSTMQTEFAASMPSSPIFASSSKGFAPVSAEYDSTHFTDDTTFERKLASSKPLLSGYSKADDRAIGSGDVTIEEVLPTASSRLESKRHSAGSVSLHSQLSHHKSKPTGLGIPILSVNDSVSGLPSAPQSPALSIQGTISTPTARPEDLKRASSQSSTVLLEMRRKVLSRDFWMKDENAKVCFRCGDQFSTFRRKHHCRTCGQIYDAKCTVLTSGKPFGQASKLRVCKTCEAILNGDDSSDYSEDDAASVSHVKQIRFSEDPDGLVSASPIVGPAGMFKRAQEFKSRPGSSDAVPALARPSSSRSLKSLSGRPRSSSHRHRRMMHQHPRYFGTSPELGAPFQSNDRETGQLKGFHTDSIIDPELAPYMSDDGSSDEDITSIAAALNTPAAENPPGGFASLLGPNRRTRHKQSRSTIDLSQVGRDAETMSQSSTRVSLKRRALGLRTFSSGSLVGFNGGSPRVARSQNLQNDYGSRVSMLRRSSIPESDNLRTTNDEDFIDSPAEEVPGGPSPSVAELNNASLDHVKLLLRQFLKDNAVDNGKRWEKTLIPLLLRCAEEVDPNINRGDDIDIRHYVKLKKAPGSLPKDSAYVSGVVFSKNLALRSMPRLLHNPRILLVSFPIVYDRHQQHFMSLEPVIAQEREYLRNLTNRIKALAPSVVLVQRQVAGLAIQFLNEAKIAVAFNVKESVLQAISRCTETPIISSVDRLTMNSNLLGQCRKFEVRTYLEEGNKKSYIFVAGCQPDLGCTIMLRGADRRTLSTLKWITEFMCFVVYNLKLETCLMRDEFVAIPSTRSAYQPNPESDARSDAVGKQSCERLVLELKTRILSVSPFVKIDEPYLLSKGQEQECQLEKLSTLLKKTPNVDLAEMEEPQPKFEMIKHEMLFDADINASPQLRAAIRAIHEAEYDRALHHYQALRRRWDAYVAGAIEPFNPLSHQQIVVLFSIVSTPSGDACEGPDLLGLEFYQEHDVENNLEPDVPLGEFVERLCHQANYPCTSHRCEKTMLDHHRQYVHGDGQIVVSMRQMASKLRGMENTILMWSICQLCQAETQVVPMSRNTWKYSFGKYLELSFWSEPMHARAGSCPHDIHKDHVRFFGFKGMAICIRYESINIMDILVPRATVAWKVDKDISLKNEQFLKIEERMSRFLASVKARIRSIKVESVDPEKIEGCKGDLASMLTRIGEEQDFLRGKLREKYMTSKHYEIVPLNRALRAMQEKVADWDATFADFEHNYFPSETDIRKLAAQQLRKVYLETRGRDSTETVDDSDESTEAEGKDDSRAREIQVNTKSETSMTKFLNSAEDLPIVQNAAATSSEPDKNAEHSLDVDTIQRLDLAIPSKSSDVQVGDQIGTNTVAQEPPVVQEDVRQEQMEVQQAQNENIASIIQHNVDAGKPSAPPLLRSQTSPSSIEPLQKSDITQPTSEIASRIPQLKGAASNFGLEKKQTSSRVAVTAALRTGKSAMQSMIPRSVPSKRNDTKVSALAKHFEQMSREFEKERLRERKQRAARDRQARVYPMSSYRPVVEVFRDATEAARERDSSLHDDMTTEVDTGTQRSTDETPVEPSSPRHVPRGSSGHPSDLGRSEAGTLVPSDAASEADIGLSEPEASVSGDTSLHNTVEPDDSSVSEQIDASIDLPKHDRSSLMKMLTSFWSERSASGWHSLDYPLAASDHIFADSDVVVREDEPSSLVAFALASQDYCSKLSRFRERMSKESEKAGPSGTAGGKYADVERTLLGTTATHMKYQFQAESARMQCKIFFAESFDAIRRRCGVAERFVESLSRCNKWDSKGGKSRSIFLKTLDERFVVKSLSPVETQAFLKFAPDYFEYMSKCLFHNLPSCLAKMLGFYQVVIKNPLTGTEFSYFLQVMENVFYENPSNRLFDLKGSMRNRRIESTGEKDEVLLDENLLDYISQSPIYVRNNSNSLLTSSITNDTLFCSKQNVMDYSLIVGLYDDRKELMVGIIDYIRTYTWDKKLESWIKDRGKHRATVRSPREYRNRFRASIPKYFPLAPSCWQVFGGPQQQQQPYQETLAPMPVQLLAEGGTEEDRYALVENPGEYSDGP